MDPGDQPYGRRPSILEATWTEFRRRLSGPIGCLVLVLCFPFVLLGLLVFVVAALFKARRIQRDMAGKVAAVRDAGEALPTALFVRTFAADASFSREEATQAAVPAASARTAAELLGDALARGWVEETADGRLAVTDRGRAETDDLLRARGM